MTTNSQIETSLKEKILDKNMAQELQMIGKNYFIR